MKYTRSVPKNVVPKFARNRKVASTLVKTAGLLTRVNKSPDDAFADLLHAVQRQQVYEDGKTFVDLVPRTSMQSIRREYEKQRLRPSFSLQKFVDQNFYDFNHTVSKSILTNHEDIGEHIENLWTNLTRRNRVNRGSLIALPYNYIVPGGRFSEQYYWDSYFIMLGLAAENRWKDIEAMIKNFTYMLRKFGYIPTANRTYFLSRSQPPFFASMVRLLAQHKGKTKTYAEYLPYLLIEYKFWMRGRLKLSKNENKAFARVVQMPNGANLNRYYDNKTTPRPESLREDVMTAETAPMRQADRLFLHLRAAAESGWDFSSRWLDDENDLGTIHTADIIPVDLNCLLYDLESLIAETYRRMRNPLLARKFETIAARRAKAIESYCWNDSQQFYGDYNFHHNLSTGRMTLAAVFPLFVGLASVDQAAKVARKIQDDFVKPGGLVTTLVNNGQQWDAPNGWAPLQWVAVVGLRRYGYTSLADEIRRRWMKTTLDIYTDDKKLVEKYNVETIGQVGGGGEYPLQDGFGWSNGVFSAFSSGLDEVI
jgi:alpha,alpha-trehalase